MIIILTLFLRHVLTGKDNQTYDVMRVLLALSVLFFLGLAVYDTLYNKKFDMFHFGTSLSALLFGGGGGIAVKSKTEPE